MSWNLCKMPECESYTARPDGDYCESCRRANAKQETEYKKQLEKRNSLLQKAKEKNLVPRKRINPMSEKRSTEKEIYDEKRERFLLTRWCAFHGHGCIPTTVHHAKGRIGTLYLDEKYWVALCMTAHEWVEKNPDRAKELGLSQSRLAKDISPYDPENYQKTI